MNVVYVLFSVYALKAFAPTQISCYRKMTSVKGILKGLRYISQIFENEKEEEDEIQIGNPTDVKHVAHIGNEGPSSNAPSWMNDYQQGSLESGIGAPSDKSGSRANNSGKTKQQKRQAQKASNASIGSPARETSSSTKPARRNKNTNMQSPGRQQNNTSIGMESPGRDLPKSSRPKKSKAANSKTKAQNPMSENFASSPARGYEMDNTGMYQTRN